MIEASSFGSWLRQHRRSLDLTQEDLSRLIGCSAATIRKFEADERCPSKQMAERLAQMLDAACRERTLRRGRAFCSARMLSGRILCWMPRMLPQSSRSAGTWMGCRSRWNLLRRA